MLTMSTDENREGKVIAVTSSSGGTGKTTLSLSLAHYLSKTEKQKVAVVEAIPPGEGDIGLYQSPMTPTLLAVVLGGIKHITLQLLLGTALHYDEESEMSLYRTTKHIVPREDFPPEIYDPIIGELKKEYDYIIVDTIGRNNEYSQQAYELADHMLYVTLSNKVQGLKMGLFLNNLLDYEKEINVVLNKAGEGADLGEEIVQKAGMGNKFIGSIPYLPEAVVPDLHTEWQRVFEYEEYEESIAEIATTLLQKFED